MLVTTTGLTKAYGNHTALSSVDVAVPDGAVYGLVGPNGAGKTTLLSILAGLRRPTAGTVEVALDRRRVAILPDTPQFDGWLTAREVVDLARSLVAPDLGDDAVDAALEDAGLSAAAGRRVGGFSRGMLQRLGLAATVVGRPALLLLDEPCSALDPAGRREVLDLIVGLAGSATIVLSSHILTDVQAVCDHVGVLRDGHLLFQGPLDELLVGQAAPAWSVRLASSLDAAADALTAESWVRSVERTGPRAMRVSTTSKAEAETGIVRVLAAVGAAVVSIEPAEPDLEHVFLELTT